MQTWKSVTDFPASMAVHSSQPGAQPHLQSQPVLIACSAAICPSQDGPLVPSGVQELGLFSELCASPHARRLRTESLQVNYLLGPSSWGSAYAPARLASQGPEHLVAGTWCPLAGLLDPCFTECLTVAQLAPLWAACSCTAQDSQCLLDWGSVNFLPFQCCALLGSWNLLCQHPQPGQFPMPRPPQWMGPIPGSRSFPSAASSPGNKQPTGHTWLR